MPRRRRSSLLTEAPISQRRPRYRYCTRSRARRDAMLGVEHDGRRLTISDEEYRSKQRTLVVLFQGKALSVISIDVNRVRNTEIHHTAAYETADLVVRRGAPFHLSVKFDRHIDVSSDFIVIQLTIGPRPQESKGTLVRLRLDAKELSRTTDWKSGWSANITSISNDILGISVRPTANCVIGKYQLYVETRLGKDDPKTVNRHQLEDMEIVVIFNPWCEDDVVFMPEEREEYVLNDTGRIWVGSSTSHSGRPWNFGQFDDPCLDCALYLLDKGELLDSARRSPISIIRCISALANSMDDNGVLEGCWTQKYPKTCTLPWAWTGSVRIIQQFMADDRPVKYGQCWVFSGLVTTLMRAVGIPTRSVTNFESAHDCDGSMTIDSHFDEDDNPVPELNDSVWNFHVWNESWMKRHDLPEGYGGWQAHDATPQETSEGVMRCGPAPLRAIKEGHVYLNYDIPFIFSEVNGDRVHWKENVAGDSEVVYIDAHAVGKYISTKAVGSNDRHDVTLDYKYAEGSAEERSVVEFVNRFSDTVSREMYDRRVKDDVNFHLLIPSDVKIGEDVTIVLTVRSEVDEGRVVGGRMALLSNFYTGVPAKRIKHEAVNIQLSSSCPESSVSVTVTAKEYLSKLNPEASLQLYACFTVSETKQSFVSTPAFSLSKPNLQVSVPDDILVGLEYEGIITFTNPLPVNVTNGNINVEGASVTSAGVHKFSKPIKPGESVSHTFKLKPRRFGRREIDATFSSDQISGVDSSVLFDVKRNIVAMDTD